MYETNPAHTPTILTPVHQDKQQWQRNTPTYDIREVPGNFKQFWIPQQINQKKITGVSIIISLKTGRPRFQTKKPPATQTNYYGSGFL